MSESMDEFTMLPLQIDSESGTVRALGATCSPALTRELEELNKLHKAISALEAAGSGHPFPPPPVPVHPKRSVAVNKFRESGNELFRKGQYQEAVRHYSLGLQTALGRPAWEPSQLLREEVATLYCNRAQAHMSLRAWADGAADAERSVAIKRMGNAKAWWRRGKCLLELNRPDDALDWISRGLEVESGEADLIALLEEIKLSKQSSYDELIKKL